MQTKTLLPNGRPYIKLFSLDSSIFENEKEVNNRRRHLTAPRQKAYTFFARNNEEECPLKTECAETYAVERLYHKSFSSEDASDIQALFTTLSPEKDPPGEHEIGLAVPNIFIWIARHKGSSRIVSMARLAVDAPFSLSNRTAKICDVVTLKEHRESGIMRSILQEIIAFARSERFLYLELSSRPERVAAHRLYKDFGFVQTAIAVKDKAFGRHYYRLYF